MTESKDSCGRAMDFCFYTRDWKTAPSHGPVRLRKQCNLVQVIPMKDLFQALKDINVFIDTCTVLNDTLAWDIGKNRDNTTCLDIDPDTLYELPNVKERIA